MNKGVPVRYLVVLETGKRGFGAYVPDLPGCVAVAGTRDETMKLIRESIEFHIEGLREAGEAIPQPASQGEVVEVDAA